MLHILYYAGEIALLILFFVIIILFIFWAIGNFKNRVPFVTSSNAVLKDIAKAMEIKDDSTLYDLGCGDGRVLFYLSKINIKAKFIGFENNLFPLVLAKMKLFFVKKRKENNIKIINADFFQQDLSKATHIFTYLYPNIMDDLLPKFDKELRPRTRLVSLSFRFTNKAPLFEVDLKRSKYKLGRKLYVYQF